jgi:DNA-binding response OmpR family regulator
MANIIIIEDYIPLARLMTEYLHNRGHHIVNAETAQEGLEKVLLQPPDVVLVDLALGTDDGLEVIRQAKAAGSKAKFLVVTATTEVKKVVEAMRSGAEDYCMKPFKLEALYNVIEECLNNGQGSSGTPELDLDLESFFVQRTEAAQSVLIHPKPEPQKALGPSKIGRQWMRCTGAKPCPIRPPIDTVEAFPAIFHDMLKQLSGSFA